MAKVTPVLWKHKENAEGRSPIYLRISAGDTTKYKSLRCYIKATHWNERTRRVRKSHKRHGEINALITQRLSEAESAILDRKRGGEAVTARHIKGSLAAPNATDCAGAGLPGLLGKALGLKGEHVPLQKAPALSQPSLAPRVDRPRRGHRQSGAFTSTTGSWPDWTNATSSCILEEFALESVTHQAGLFYHPSFRLLPVGIQAWQH